MARNFPNTSGNCFLKTGLISGPPLSLFCWFDTPSTGQNDALVSLGRNAAGSDWAYLVQLAAGTMQIGMRGSSSADDVSVTSSNSANTGAWNRALGTISGGGATVNIFLNGTETNDSAATPASVASGMNEFIIGRAPVSAWGQETDATVAEVAAWDAELTAAEAAMLEAGFSPLFVRPQNLRHYARMVREVTDMMDGGTFTETGTSTVAAHPPIIMPR